MSNRSSIRKWLIYIGSFFVAIGIGFLFAEGASTVIGTVSLGSGICLYIASNFFRTQLKQENDG